MKILELSLQAQEPLIITSGPADGMAHECLSYIPGNMLLGALAQIWIKKRPGQCPDDSPAFRRLFLDGAVAFGHAYPEIGGRQCLPVPASFMREKGAPGLPVAGIAPDGEDFGVFNLAALEKEDNFGEKYREATGKTDAPKLKRLASAFMDRETLQEPDMRKLWNIHVALGESRAAIEGQLFGYEAIAPGASFKSLIYCEDGAAIDLNELLAEAKAIRVGHARSAGYGLVSLQARWRKSEAQALIKSARPILYLRSQYIAQPAWQEPLENLIKQIKRETGAKVLEKHVFGNFVEIAGFSGHWQKPRDTRVALAAGSVIILDLDREASLPASLALGGCQIEGYGRIEINPAFLQAFDPRPVLPSASQPEEKAAPASDLNTPVWRILRDRALKRQAEQAAANLLASEPWREFLASAAKNSRPGPSQRNALKGMNLAQFEAMLKKTSGPQWKDAVCYSPFSKRREHLADVIIPLLEAGESGREGMLKFAPEPVLPGGRASGEENREWRKLAYGYFLADLVTAWNKLASLQGGE